MLNVVDLFLEQEKQRERTENTKKTQREIKIPKSLEGCFALIRKINEKPVKNRFKRKKVYLYTVDKELVEVFETTDECANYFNKSREYIYHNLKYRNRIRRKHKWYIISREKL